MYIKNFNVNKLNQSIESGDLVIVKFFATWCGPCQMYAPIYEEVANNFKDILFFSIDIDKFNEISEKYKVSTIPTTLIFKNREMIASEIGFLTNTKLNDFVTKNK